MRPRFVSPPAPHLANESLANALVIPVRGGEILVIVVGRWPILVVVAVQGCCGERASSCRRQVRGRGRFRLVTLPRGGDGEGGRSPILEATLPALHIT